MPYATDLDPSDSVLSFYVTDLRRKRERAGITQRALARTALMAPSLLNKIEAGKRLPTKDLSAAADEIFGSDDYFKRLWPLVIRYAYPAWFRPFVELEEAATCIRTFQVQVVPGLLQTEAYARAVFTAGRPDLDELEEQVAARLERQRILTRKDRPELWVVLDEAVLRRRTGTAATMCAQLQHLLDAADEPRTVIQVVPFEFGCHAGVEGPFSALTLDEGPDVVYVDGFLQGQILAEPSQIRTAHRTYDLLVGAALSPTRSLDLIADAMKEYTP